MSERVPKAKRKTNVGVLILPNLNSLSYGSRAILLMETPECVKISKRYSSLLGFSDLMACKGATA